MLGVLMVGLRGIRCGYDDRKNDCGIAKDLL